MTHENEPETFEDALKFYLQYRTRFEQLENEFDEYQQSSLNYEQELEIQLKQIETQNQRLQHDLFLERTQNEQYRERSEDQIKRFDQQLDQIQDELNTCQNLNQKLTQYIRELEQTNDDLERSKRTLLDSLSTFETKLNHALEQNALLENELDDKEQLTETVQRLRDETRDLREELDVLHKTKEEKTIDSNSMTIINSDRMQSILSEAGATSNRSSIYDPTKRASLSTGDDHHVSILKTRTVTTTADLQIAQENNSSRSISNSTRLESLKLIDQAFQRFNHIESTLSTQRKQSHSKCLPSNNGTHMKSTRLIANQTQS